MLLSEFCLSAVEHIVNGDYGVKPDVRLYTDGYQSSDKEELEFIHSSNIKYHNTESDTLIGTYFGIFWKNENSPAMTCRIEAAYLMGMYQSGGWENVDRVVRYNIDHAIQVASGVLSHMSDYDAVREHLMIRPLSYARNRLTLKENVYRQLGDVALALYVKLQDTGGDLMSAKVPMTTMQKWGLPEEEVLSKAMENTALLYPPRIYLSPDELENPPYLRGVFMGEGEGRVARIESKICATLTTTRQLNGAAALFYPGVQERIAELYDGSYFALLTSDSEVMLHSAEVMTAWSAYKALKRTNRRFRDSTISNVVFRYNADAKALEILNF